MKIQKQEKDIACGSYVSPAVKVMEFRTRCVLCLSPDTLTGINEGEGDGNESYGVVNGDW